MLIICASEGARGVDGQVWQHHPVEVRQAIAALCWMSYAWGWLHHREGLALA